MKDQLVEIANHLQGQLDHLDKLSTSDDHIVGFDQYKAVYDTLIALRQAQALARIATQLEGQVALLQGDDIVDQLANIRKIIEFK